MGFLVRGLIRFAEMLMAVPWAVFRFVMGSVVFNPKLGPLRHVVTAGLVYVVFAVLLVYVVAPVRGYVGARTMGDQLRYASERWLATAVYDKTGAFVGTFDPRMDSLQDVNWTDRTIEIGSYVANPDHKSIPVKTVPEAYWQCLSWHEDRYIGGWLNPAGIDLVGVLKIPYTSVVRTIQMRRPHLGVGGSTLPMQFARVIFKTPPSPGEGGLGKLRRKVREWWLAPVIYHTLTQGGDDTPLKQWAANHIWLAQRTGGQPLHGIEVTARIVFGKEASELSTAEQFVLASAVNKPIILMPGSEKLNAVRDDRWKYITEVRARTCAEKLIADAAEQSKVLFELVQMAGGPPDPRVKRRMQTALEKHAPNLAKRAEANPYIRMAALMPAARYGIREEMKLAYGAGWRDHVRGVTTTIDPVENLAFHDRVKAALARIDQLEGGKIASGFTLDPARVEPGRRMPDVVVVAANEKGEIVRYYEAGETAPYFGSPMARDRQSGTYDRSKDGRQIASTGKIMTAIAIANELRDQPGTLYDDPLAPERGAETCARGAGATPGQRRAFVAFACSLNKPLETRSAQLGQGRLKLLVDKFGFNMPPVDANGEGTPPSTATVRGLVGGSPRRVHHMAGVVLASLVGQGNTQVRAPSLVRTFDYTSREAAAARMLDDKPIVPNTLIKPNSRAMLRTLLSAPLCHRVGREPVGTLRSLAGWCADGRSDVRLHFAKTGTSTTMDADATVDTWTAGGIQFANGAAYSYVVMVGTGAARDTWGTKLHAAQVSAPLVGLLLDDLKGHSVANPNPALLPQPVRSVAGTSGAHTAPVPGAPGATAAIAKAGKSSRPQVPDWQRRQNESF